MAYVFDSESCKCVKTSWQDGGMSSRVMTCHEQINGLLELKIPGSKIRINIPKPAGYGSGDSKPCASRSGDLEEQGFLKKPAYNPDWLFYFELRNFAALNNPDKIIYNVSER